MISYIPFHFESSENVSPSSFESKISDTLKLFKEMYELRDNDVRQVRFSSSIWFPINSGYERVEYRVYNIWKCDKLVSSLNCVLSLDYNYIEISSYL